MKKRDRKALRKYVRALADELQLRDWDLIVHTDGVDIEDALAEIHAVEGRQRAHIHFADDFRARDRSEQRQVVVHELVHCHLTPAQHQVERDLESVLGGQADALFSAAFRRNLEYAVDALADAFAPHLPLIDWP